MYNFFCRKLIFSSTIDLFPRIWQDKLELLITEFQQGRQLQSPWGDCSYTTDPDAILELATPFTTEEMKKVKWRSSEEDDRKTLTLAMRSIVRQAVEGCSPDPTPEVNAQRLRDFVSRILSPLPRLLICIFWI
jgi:hypothetical protein